MKKSSTQKLKEYEEKIKELERVVGSKQMNIDYLEKLIQAAENHYGEDFKKNLNTKPSS